jgi:hypothetical protein
MRVGSSQDICGLKELTLKLEICTVCHSQLAKWCTQLPGPSAWIQVGGNMWEVGASDTLCKFSLV